MRDTDGVVLAIDFGGTKIAACACAPTGHRLDEGVVATTPALGANENFERGISLARGLAGGTRVVAVGACTFGIPAEDGVGLSPAISGWDELPLRRSLEAALGAPAVVATDVKVAAAAEARHGALAGCDPAIYVNLGTGLAVAILAGGAVLRGAHGAAGEIGYALPRRTASPDGPGRTAAGDATGARRRAPMLEDVVSGMGLARTLAALREESDPGAAEVWDGDGSRAVRASGAGSDVRRAGQRTALDAARVAELFATAGDGDDRAARVLDEFLDELAFHLVNLTIAVDPERIAVGGGMVRAWDRIETPLRRALESHVPYPPELVLGAYPFDAPLRGAVDLGVALVAQTAAT